MKREQLVAHVANEILFGGDSMNAQDLLYITRKESINRRRLKRDVAKYITTKYPKVDERYDISIWDSKFLLDQLDYWFPELTKRKVSNGTIHRRLRSRKPCCPMCGSYKYTHGCSPSGMIRTVCKCGTCIDPMLEVLYNPNLTYVSLKKLRAAL